MLRLSSLQPPFASLPARYLAQRLDRLIYLRFYILIISPILSLLAALWGGGRKGFVSLVGWLSFSLHKVREVEFCLKIGLGEGPHVLVAFALGVG